MGRGGRQGDDCLAESAKAQMEDSGEWIREGEKWNGNEIGEGTRGRIIVKLLPIRENGRSNRATVGLSSDGRSEGGWCKRVLYSAPIAVSPCKPVDALDEWLEDAKTRC